MANYTKTAAPLVVDEDADGKYIKIWKHLQGVTKTPYVTIDLPGLGPDEAALATFLPSAADRTALKGLIDKITAVYMTRKSATVVP